MRVSSRTALGVAIACTVLAGCSSDGDDPVTLPTTTTTSASAEPSTPPPSTPAAVPTPTTTLALPDEHVPAVDELVSSFFDALNEAKTSGDFTTFDALYLPQCTGCSELRTEVQGWLESGQSVDGGDWHVIQLSSNESSDGSLANFGVLVYRAEATVFDEAGGVLEVFPATDVLFGAGGLRPGSPWVIEDMGLTES